MKVGDIVKHPTDGDIGIVLSINNRHDGVFYAIHWMKDGYLHPMRYTPLEVITDRKCP